MSEHEYIKYVTSRLVQYMHENKRERQKRKIAQKSKYTISHQWFGLIPFTIQFIFNKRKENDMH